MDKPDFTERQREIINLLTQGKSNKEIALALGKSERTVEDHLNHIYAMLGVSSRAEAIIKLARWYILPSDGFGQAGKSTVGENSDPAVVSTVDEPDNFIYHDEEQAKPNLKLYKWISALSVIGILILASLFFEPKKAWAYEREAEFPNDFSTGEILDRSNASEKKVHGQFGSQSTSPWSAQPGFVLYNKINIEQSGPLYLQICYSKFSKSSVPMQITIDEEATPRESIYPIDQGDWNKFICTEWIALGEITKGLHSIKFFTNGQEFGVADLDKFILTTEPPK